MRVAYRLTQAQRQRIHELENSKGQITPQRVVQDAKSKKSPLHALFDWDRQRAAEKWWLHQAREILGSVTVPVSSQGSKVNSPY